MLLGEIKKNLSLRFYIVGVLGIFTLLLFNEAIADAASGKVYLVIELLYGKGKELAKEDFTSSGFFIWTRECSIWITFFAPLLVSVGYILNIVNEKKTGYVRMMLQRAGIRRYCFCKVVGGAISAGIIMMSAYLAFGIFSFGFLNSINSYDVPKEILNAVMPSGLYLSVLGFVMGAFLYGAFMGLFGIIVCLFFTDKYLVTCIPVLLSFGYDRILVAMFTTTSNRRLWEKIYRFFPDKLKYLFGKDFSKEIVGVLVCGYIFAEIAYMYLYHRRKMRDDWT